MRAWWVIGATILLAGCSIPVDQPPVETPAESSVPESAPETEAPEAKPKRVRVSAKPKPTIPAPPATAGELNDLEGSTWTAQEYTFEFQRGGNVLVLGGRFKEIAPSGAPGRVTADSGLLTFDIMGRTSWGTWDGTDLIIDGRLARRAEAATR